MFRFALLSAILMACAPEESPKWLSADQAALPLGSVAYPVPGPAAAGRPLEIVYQGPANARVGMFWSDGVLGSGPCYPFLGGECLDITPGTTGINSMLIPDTDSNGITTARFRLPRGVPAGDYVLQVASEQSGTIDGSPPFGLQILPYAEDCPTPGASEPNDEAASAPLYGTVPPSGVVCEVDRNDWFAFDTTAGSSVVIDVGFSHADGDIDIFVLDRAYNSFGTLIAENAVAFSAGVGDSEFVVFTPQTTGTYYVVVSLFADSGATVGNDYDINITSL